MVFLAVVSMWCHYKRKKTGLTSLFFMVIYHLTYSVSSMDFRSSFIGTDIMRNLSLFRCSNGDSSLRGWSITMQWRHKDETGQEHYLRLTLHIQRPIRRHNTSIRSHTVEFRSRCLHFEGHFFIWWIAQRKHLLGCPSKWSYGGNYQKKEQPGIRIVFALPTISKPCGTYA
jgi:hypothetical protein